MTGQAGDSRWRGLWCAGPTAREAPRGRAGGALQATGDCVAPAQPTGILPTSPTGQ